MDWRGTEWAIPVYEAAICIVPFYSFFLVRRRIRRGQLTRIRAFLYYSALSLSPPVIYSGYFFGLVGLEDATNMAIVTEGLAATFLILIGFGLCAWLASSLIFGLSLYFVKYKSPGGKAG